MAGIGLVLNTAKDALLTQQYAMDVVSHNVANVNTEGYSRQTSIIEANLPAPYAGFIFGTGVGLQEIQRQTDTFVETRLREEESGLAAMSEQETYLSVLEGVFDESSGNSISSQFDEFWSAWQDLSNNPSGSAERTILYEKGTQLAQTFQDIRDNLDQFETELNLSLDAGAEKINQLTSEIAELNEQIISMEVNGNANDLRDQRDMRIRELSTYLDINVFEDTQGNLTVTTGRGFTLVSKTDSYELSFEQGEVMWESSAGQTPITDFITGGKMGGWLEVRDAYLPKYRNELDELAKNVIWEVNKVHSQGVGLEGMTSVTGTYGADDPAAALDSSGLDFQDSLTSGQFSFWVYDANGDVVDLGGPGGSLVVTVDPATDRLNDIRDALNGLDGGNITASVDIDTGQLTISGANGRTFAFSEDSSGVLAALGINTFFDGKNAQNIAMNETLNSHNEYITAGCVDSTSGEIAVGDNANALNIASLRDQTVAMNRYTYDDPDTVASNPADTFQGYFTYLVGSVGIKSESVQREQGYAEVVVNQLTEERNNLSAVSLDEEMTNLIKFQHAYSAAAKLVSTADEMLQTLLETR